MLVLYIHLHLADSDTHPYLQIEDCLPAFPAELNTPLINMADQSVPYHSPGQGQQWLSGLAISSEEAEKLELP